MKPLTAEELEQLEQLLKRLFSTTNDHDIRNNVKAVLMKLTLPEIA